LEAENNTDIIIEARIAMPKYREPLIAVWAGIGINVISICLKILMTASIFFLWILFKAFKR